LDQSRQSLVLVHDGLSANDPEQTNSGAMSQ
jgi:hypothetical protein